MTKVSTTRFRWLRWVPVILWMALIFTLSQFRGQSSGSTSKWILDLIAGIGLDLEAWLGDTAHFLIRKSAHFTEYFILYLLVVNATKSKKNFRKRIWWSYVFTVGYAITDEVHQVMVPGRNGNVRDVLIDAGGAMLALGVWVAFTKLFRKTK